MTRDQILFGSPRTLFMLLAAVWLVVGSPYVNAAPVAGQGTWESTLHARDLNWDGTPDAYYDTTLNITWLADWDTNGYGDWYTQSVWAATLNVYGVSGWRLPATIDVGADGCGNPGDTECGYNFNPATSEMAHMWYVTLGNLTYCDPPASTIASCSSAQPGRGLTNTANFIDIAPNFYWSGTELASSPTFAWYFVMSEGLQFYIGKGFPVSAVAVHDGDVVTVSEPATILLLGLGLGGLGFSRTRRV